tara:strand:+ start:271 stop:720 length:450 start_codon:yes stop_codon:yes gene_type:complete
MNNTQSVKIVRLQSGEDIIANYIENEENEMVQLDNPMHLIFKRTTKGTVMLMLPWLPIELIKVNSAMIYTSDILTVYEPKDDLILYYDNIVNESQIKELMEEESLIDKLNMSEDYEDEDYDEGNDDEESPLTKEELNEIISRKRSSRLH